MSTVVVWVLIMWPGFGSAVVIDNIATERNCRGVLAAYKQYTNDGHSDGMCIAVRKAVVK